MENMRAKFYQKNFAAHEKSVLHKGVEWMLLNGSKVVMMAAVTASVNGCETMTFMCHHQQR
jgi:hypothetical protein